MQISPFPEPNGPACQRFWGRFSALTFHKTTSKQSYIKNNMSDFRYMKNDMPKIGHIKIYIQEEKGKAPHPRKLGFAVLFTPVWFNYWGEREWSW
ncbi:MAG: hypothetical protein J6K29_05920 [Clostridia bacterium]|nr:hypothetical protein [Clostridia bacterium]